MNCFVRNIKRAIKILQIMSIRNVCWEMRFDSLIDNLEEIVPDITHQYSSFVINSKYLRTKVRAQHAFQIQLLDGFLDEKNNSIVFDIGDSAGTHIQYIKALYPLTRAMSLNLDEFAVERVKAKGLEAVCARAEELPQMGYQADIFLCYETLEHIMDPIGFLRNMAKNVDMKKFVITVPYLKRSRVGLHKIKNRQQVEMCGEDLHIFEFCPEDWNAIFALAGWRVVKESIYRQYPTFSPLWLMKFFWRKYDFEGFYGVVLEKDETWPSLYKDW